MMTIIYLVKNIERFIYWVFRVCVCVHCVVSMFEMIFLVNFNRNGHRQYDDYGEKKHF